MSQEAFEQLVACGLWIVAALAVLGAYLTLGHIRRATERTARASERTATALEYLLKARADAPPPGDGQR